MAMILILELNGRWLFSLELITGPQTIDHELSTMELIIIAAIAENRVIGRDGKIPWHISEDMQRFKQLTLHHPVIMGRKTWESIPSKYRPLPGRVNLVLSRQEGYQADGAYIFPSLEAAVDSVKEHYAHTFVMGGQAVYEQALPLAQRMEITEVHFPYKGDAYFPDFNKEEWRESSRVKRGQYSFVSYVRK